MEAHPQEDVRKEEEHRRKPKSAFTEKEDQTLLALVQQYGNKDWNAISKSMGTRTARQCRERYNLYLRPDVQNSPWTDEEDEKLIRLFAQYGSKWSVIAQNFHNRTANNIKNRFKQYQRHLKRHSRQGNAKDVISDPFVLAHIKFVNQVNMERQQKMQEEAAPQIVVNIDQNYENEEKAQKPAEEHPPAEANLAE